MPQVGTGTSICLIWGGGGGISGGSRSAPDYDLAWPGLGAMTGIDWPGAAAPIDWPGI